MFVYLHKRPDGTVFYVGKGSEYRANEFSPTRRTAHHNNIVAKHGRGNIKVQLIPCLYEREAFELEKALIGIYRSVGGICNITSGGEGAAGRKASEKQLQALARGRLPGKAKPKSMENTRTGRMKAAEKQREWAKTEAGKAHFARILALRLEKQDYKTLTCAHCGDAFSTLSNRAKCCSKNCQQRLRRAHGGK
jgi:hypothetical protein